ncbi:MAG: universal stress protein [Bacteroidetes bacterium]|nr:universal stress protein [Bacteroidota bacterium]
MNNILCPIDFSGASLTAIEFAGKIAKKHSSTVKMLHVITEGEYAENLSKSEDYYKNIEKKPAQKLKALADEINKNHSLGYELCSFEITEGDLIEKIADVTEAEKISLIVMGTTGVSDINEARVGSNTVKVIENTDIPVLCIPENIMFYAFKRIVYGSTFSSDDKEFFQSVVNFAVPFDSRIYVVHITNNNDAISDENYQNYVSNMKSYFVYEKLGFEQFITDQETGIALEHLLHVHKAHLLILVHKRRNFIGSFFHKSLTKRMSYLTNFPLLVLRN